MQRTAVGAHRRSGAERITPGDRFFLYTTRGCFRNPTRDRGRVIGIARVTSPAREAPRPVRFGDREFPIEIPLEIERRAPFRGGVELAPLIGQLRTFPTKHAWSAYLRRALVPLDDADAQLLEEALEPISRP